VLERDRERDRDRLRRLGAATSGIPLIVMGRTSFRVRWQLRYARDVPHGRPGPPSGNPGLLPSEEDAETHGLRSRTALLDPGRSIRPWMTPWVPEATSESSVTDRGPAPAGAGNACSNPLPTRLQRSPGRLLAPTLSDIPLLHFFAASVDDPGRMSRHAFRQRSILY
jgi:hypothetical protein